jgi:hypothetical protein
MMTTAINEQELKYLCEMMHYAFLEIRVLCWQNKAEQAAELADVFHEIPQVMFFSNFNMNLFIERLKVYQEKYNPPLSYTTIINHIINKDYSNDIVRIYKEKSRKQDIYIEMLMTTIPHLRNSFTWPWWNQFRIRKNNYYEAELVHNLGYSILEREFTGNDIHFLNYQAKIYYENGKNCANYIGHTNRIKELFSLIPGNMKSALNWLGPE